MTPAGLLAELHRCGVEIDVTGPTPRLAWDEAAPPPPELIEAARQNRTALIALAVTAGESNAAPAPEAPIPEIARGGILRLDTMPVPGDFTPTQWAEAIDAARYVAAEWLTPALSLGWQMPDVFGCHPMKPRAALHMAGLTLCLRPGDRASALSATSAAIVGVTGAARTFRIQPVAGDRILLWELAPGQPITARANGGAA